MIHHEMTKEERVEIVLTASLTLSHAALARQVGLNRESVRQIRIGKLYRTILPDLPRQERNVRTHRCWQCGLATTNQRPRGGTDREDRQWCSLGFPEGMDPLYAAECPSFVSHSGRL